MAALGSTRRSSASDAGGTRRRHHNDADASRGRRASALTAAEFGSFFILLVVAGNETTRNAISHGMHELTDHPDQRVSCSTTSRADTPTAVEEIVRWATPVIHFRRTATRDIEIGGQTIRRRRQGRALVQLGQPRRGEFDEPDRFDVRRTPNEHVGFGAGGPALLPRRQPGPAGDQGDVRRSCSGGCPTSRPPEPPEMLQSAFIHGIKRMPCASPRPDPRKAISRRGPRWRRGRARRATRAPIRRPAAGSAR